MIRDAPPFSKDFYQQFARDMYDKSDGSPWPLQRWTSTPNFYVRTVDDANHAVEQTVINTTIEALRRGVSAFTAGHYSAGSIETGTDERPDATDWINVVFKRHDPDQPCGTAYVGRNPNTIKTWLRRSLMQIRECLGSCRHRLDCLHGGASFHSGTQP